MWGFTSELSLIKIIKSVVEQVELERFHDSLANVPVVFSKFLALHRRMTQKTTNKPVIDQNLPVLTKGGSLSFGTPLNTLPRHLLLDTTK